jgi:UDP-N-acetyl-D-glucosamine dehydrogenase
MSMSLEQKLSDRSAHLGVIGLGYVGLPLLVEFARAGFKAIGVDVDPARCAKVNDGVSYVKDVPSKELSAFAREGRIRATTDFEVLREMDGVNICVPTPLRKSRDPDVSYIVAAVDEIAPRLHPGQIIILESTTYPGTTEELILPKLEAEGLTVGRDFYLAFSPERVDPGNPVYQTRNIPKVVGGVTPECTRLAMLLYKQCLDTVVPVSSTRTAEMVKLLENTFRSVNIGLVNELALMSDKMGMDVWEIIDAAATKPFGFMPFYPGPGLGGHCIPVDPFYLSWKARASGFEARFIELAGQVNSQMPYYVAARVARALNGEKKAVNGSRILVVGVAYKADIDDVRESPSLDILEILRGQGAEVSYHDPYVPQVRTDHLSLAGQPLTAESVKRADCVVVATAHSGIDYDMILQHAPLIVDTRNVYKGRRDPRIARL